MFTRSFNSNLFVCFLFFFLFLNSAVYRFCTDCFISTRTHFSADLTGENFGLVSGTRPVQSNRGARGLLKDLVGEDLVPLLHVVLDLALGQVLEGLDAGHAVPLPGLMVARFALLRHEGFVAGAEKIRGHRVEVDEPGGRWTHAAVTAAVQVTHGAQRGESGLVDDPRSEEFVLTGGVGHGRVLLLVLTVQAET